jgi:hypothetical protein
MWRNKEQGASILWMAGGYGSNKNFGLATKKRSAE